MVGMMRLAAVVAGFLVAAAAHAQSYPTGPITIVNPYAAGGPADLITRTIGAVMSQELGQQVLDFDVVVGPRDAQPRRLLQRTAAEGAQLVDEGLQVEAAQRGDLRLKGRRNGVEDRSRKRARKARYDVPVTARGRRGQISRCSAGRW